MWLHPASPYWVYRAPRLQSVAHVTVTVRLFGPKSNRLIIQKSVGWSDTPLTVTVLAVVPLAVPKGVTVRGKPCI